MFLFFVFCFFLNETTPIQVFKKVKYMKLHLLFLCNCMFSKAYSFHKI